MILKENVTWLIFYEMNLFHMILFVTYKKQDNYTEISKPNLTFQKENNIVKNFISEDLNRINLLKLKKHFH